MTLNAMEGKALPIYGDGGNVRDWLFVEDHCTGILRVLEKGKLGEKYNIGGNTELNNLDVVDRICAVLEEILPAAENEKLIKLTENDIPKMTKSIIVSFFEFHKKNPLFWRLLAWENLNGGKSLSDQNWKKIESNYIEHLRGLYEIGQKKRLFNQKILFSTYIISIFAITFFYYSNQITISHLLSLDIKKTDFQLNFINEVQTLFEKGCGAKE